MQNTEQNMGTNLVIAIAIIGLACASLALNWGTYHLRTQDFDRQIDIPPLHHGPGNPTILSVYATGMKLRVTGATGEALVWPVAFKYRLCTALVVTAVLLHVLISNAELRLQFALALSLCSLFLILVAVFDLVHRGGWAQLEYGWVPCLISCFISSGDSAWKLRRLNRLSAR